MQCRFCNASLESVFIDLINSPASNSFLVKEQLNEPETFYPLKVYVCEKCRLVQIDEYKKSDSIFNSDYVYFSSYSLIDNISNKDFIFNLLGKIFSNSEGQGVSNSK